MANTRIYRLRNARWGLLKSFQLQLSIEPETLRLEHRRILETFDTRGLSRGGQEYVCMWKMREGFRSWQELAPGILAPHQRGQQAAYARWIRSHY
jgi:hypothetical protein